MLHQYLEAVRTHAERKLPIRSEQANLIALETHLAQEALADIPSVLVPPVPPTCREKDDEEVATAIDEVVATHFRAAASADICESLTQLEIDTEAAADAAASQLLVDATRDAIQRKLACQQHVDEVLKKEKVQWECANNSIRWWTARLGELLLDSQ